jgi:hypothetical protein
LGGKNVKYGEEIMEFLEASSGHALPKASEAGDSSCLGKLKANREAK